MDMSEALTLLVTKALEDNSMPSPELYQYWNGIKNNTIIINDEICGDTLNKYTLMLRNMMLDDNVKDITIIIDSPGGDVYSGFAFVDILKRVKKPVNIEILGMAASMGGLIAMTKTPYITRRANKFSVGLIHGGSCLMEGSATAVKDLYMFNQKYEEKIKEHILENCPGISETMYESMERKENWMSADDMLEIGMIDEIIE